METDVVVAPNRGGRPERDPREWTEAFLAHYEAWGSLVHAAAHAGVSPTTARKHRRADHTFYRHVRDARQAFRESLEMELVRQARGGGDPKERPGSFLATVARLKASGRRMHARYSEKVADAQALTVNVTNNYLTLETDSRELLAHWRDDVTPATLALVDGAPTVVDADPAPRPDDGV